MIEKVSIPEGQRGDWRVVRFDVSADEAAWASVRALRDGRGGIVPGTYTKLVCKGRGTVMSDTPDERRDHMPAYRKAKGHVLINGLGLGMVLGAILKKSEVESVTVVEISQDVIDLVWPHYACDRLKVVKSCAYAYDPPKGVRYGAVWHDIWDSICADNLPSMTRLKRKYGRRADWQGCWAEGWLR